MAILLGDHWPLTTNRRSFVLGQSRGKNSPGFPDVSSLAVAALITSTAQKIRFTQIYSV